MKKKILVYDLVKSDPMMVHGPWCLPLSHTCKQGQLIPFLQLTHTDKPVVSQNMIKIIGIPILNMQNRGTKWGKVTTMKTMGSSLQRLWEGKRIFSLNFATKASVKITFPAARDQQQMQTLWTRSLHTNVVMPES